MRASRFKQHKRSNKFNAQKTVLDGITFDSKVEAKYYYRLKQKQVNFNYHESFEVLPTQRLGGKTYRKVNYTPDFVLYDGDEMIKVVDVKGGNATLTDAQKLRFKLFMNKYNVPVTVARFDYRTGTFSEEQV